MTATTATNQPILGGDVLCDRRGHLPPGSCQPEPHDPVPAVPRAVVGPAFPGEHRRGDRVTDRDEGAVVLAGGDDAGVERLLGDGLAAVDVPLLLAADQANPRVRRFGGGGCCDRRNECASNSENHQDRFVQVHDSPPYMGLLTGPAAGLGWRVTDGGSGAGEGPSGRRRNVSDPPWSGRPAMSTPEQVIVSASCGLEEALLRLRAARLRFEARSGRAAVPFPAPVQLRSLPGSSQTSEPVRGHLRSC